MLIPQKIGPFVIDNKRPTTMKYGSYYHAKMTIPFSKEKERMVRVWLPEDYDFNNPNKRFPVIYFSDGQNLVNRYLSAYGEWELDRTVHQLLNENLSSVIAVGIDCPKELIERTRELCPPYKPRKEVYKREGGEFHPHGHKFIDYIVDVIKPLIDEKFFTLSEKEYTGIAGSSMGGIMAFYAYMYRPDVFGFSLSFSPAFFFYKKNDWKKIMDEYEIDPEKNGKLFLYVGGTEFESIFLKPTFYTYEFLKKKGFENNQVSLLVDTDQGHNEAAWAKYLPDGLRFWLKD